MDDSFLPCDLYEGQDATELSIYCGGVMNDRDKYCDETHLLRMCISVF